MKTLLRSRLILSVLAAALAGGIAFSLHLSKTASDQPVSVFYPEKVIASGTPLTIHDLRSGSLPSGALHGSELTSPEDVEGKIALQDLDPRNPVYLDQLGSAEDLRQAELTALAPREGYRYMTLALSHPEDGIGPEIRKGSLVSAYVLTTVSLEDGDVVSCETPELLKELPVLALRSSSYLEGTMEAPIVPAFLTLEVTDAQAQMLTQIQHTEQQELHFTFVGVMK